MGTISISPARDDGPLRPEPAKVRANSSIRKERSSNEGNEVSNASGAAAAKEAAKAALDMQKLEDTVSDANKLMQSMNRSLKFTVDKGTERIVVKVVDDSTGEVIRQVPPEEILRLKAHFNAMLESEQNKGDSTPIMLSVKT